MNRMTGTPEQTPQTPVFQQADFEKITQTVSLHFQTVDSFMEHGIPTYHLKQPQETKEPFLKLLKDLEKTKMLAILRKTDGKTVLKVIPKPIVKPSNVLINWLLFFATIGTTFLTGYLLSTEFADKGLMASPFIGAAAFTVAIMTVLGAHEMGHKLTANKNGMDATPPYFIPGPPPIGDLLGFGTFGAVIMQKSLPPNRDALFDIGSSGPIVGFILAVAASIIGLVLSPIYPGPVPGGGIPAPLIFELFAIYLIRLPANSYVVLHPVAFAGWVGMIVTMLNILPAGSLDGGHVARSLFSDKVRTVLTMLSVVLLVVEGFWPMAFFVLLMSMYRHPGPLDDVSGLSTRRKLIAAALVVVFILCSFLHYWVLYLLQLLGL